MKTKKRIVIVAGYLVRHPLGGHALSILHYLVGLKKLSFEVVFIEHFGWKDSCYDPSADNISDDPSYGIKEMLRNFKKLGLDKWCYVDANKKFHGLSQDQVKQLCVNAELLLSIWQTTWLDEFFLCKKRVFIDTDPG